MKKIFLGVLIASVALSAVIGIGVILIGNFGEFEIRVLTTTFTVAVASILGLACGAAYESGRHREMSLAGIIFAIVAGLSWLLIIWANQELHEYVVKSIMSVTLIAAALAHLSLISLARLDKRFQWAHTAIYLTVAALCGLTLALIWFTDALESDITFRALGVLSILGAALTIVIPVFHKLSNVPAAGGGDADSEAAAIDAEIADLKARIAELKERRRGLESGESGETNEFGESEESGESNEPGT